MQPQNRRALAGYNPGTGSACPDPATPSEDVRDLLQRMGSPNVTRMISHAEGPMKAYARLGTTLLMRGKPDSMFR